ncbi:MAG: hypothetical protein BroJett042_02850 [Bacteroidota bacterium]|nr:MAG: hypothetical protein BroJett042_02850 [Bacteroidota bacterium]
MAKATSKPVTEKKVAKKAAPKAKSLTIDAASEAILDKLRSLNIEHSLQSDLEWCLGSYRYDGNPVGLIDAINRALTVLKAEQAKKTKGVTAAFITGIAKAIA